MTQNVPQHGGVKRVAFNGGQEETGTLPFLARSVNIDNLSPFWYRLFPIDEYIPPFEIGINIRLPYVTGFRFACEAPPGLEQSIILPTTGIRGNNKPVIAVFSSLDTNNDIGYNALDLAGNVSDNLISVSGASPLTVETIDLTLYNGVYFFIRARSNFRINFQYDSSQIIESYDVYNNEKLLFTIPKLGQLLTITADNPDPAENITLNYNARPFFGYADFSIQRLGSTGANPPSNGIAKNIVGSGQLTFNTVGIDNAIITIKPRNNVGNAFTDTIGVSITVSSYFSSSLAQSSGPVYTKLFLYGDGSLPLIVPIYSILAKQFNNITVSIDVSNPATSVDIVLHHVDNNPTAINQGGFDYTHNPEPYPFNAGVNGTVNSGVNTLLFTFPQFGRLTKLIISPTQFSVTANATIRFALGTVVAPLLTIGVMSAVGSQQGTVYFDQFRPMPMINGISSLWCTLGGASPFSFAWNVAID